MDRCSIGIAPVVNEDIFSSSQGPRDFEREYMKRIPYALVVGSLICAQVCTSLDLAHVVGILGRYQSDLGMDHWKTVKKVMCYLQGTKDYMLTFRKRDGLTVTDYYDSDIAGCLDTMKSTSGYIFMHSGGPIS
ncbi:secreted RxLR effector protein 161-like [Tasmannia lanceolata]|uniref:secreted RxLR effector protein 161-like n=1 Tax=Tasmannia lanceolata TaxID=3420 RepID=UPI00406443EA